MITSQKKKKKKKLLLIRFPSPDKKSPPAIFLISPSPLTLFDAIWTTLTDVRLYAYGDDLKPVHILYAISVRAIEIHLGLCRDLPVNLGKLQV